MKRYVNGIPISFLAIISFIFTACSVSPGNVSLLDKYNMGYRAGNLQKSFVLFDDDFPSGGYTFTFPKGSLIEVDDVSPYSGEGAIKITLVKKDYSGAAFAFPKIDLRPFRKKGALQFWVKVTSEAKFFTVNLTDSDKSDGMKVDARLPVQKFANPTSEWQKVVIPLRKFKDVGLWWDGASEQAIPVDYSDIIEMKIQVVQPENQDQVIYIDDVRIVEEIATLPTPEMFAPKYIMTDSHDDGVYLGLYSSHIEDDTSTIALFEKALGKKVAQILKYIDWTVKFEDIETWMNIISASGHVPHITWEPWDYRSRKKVGLKSIISGERDDYIRGFAQGIKKWGQSMFLRVLQDFNTNWFPWSIHNNSRDPEVWKQAYKHIIDIFRSEEVTNVQWIWSPNAKAYNDQDYNKLENIYPGDDYVDWVGINAMNFGEIMGGWDGFKTLLLNVYRDVEHIAPSKPMMLSELASSEDGGDKAEWIRQVSNILRVRFPRIKSFVWWSDSREVDWRFYSSPSSLKASQEEFGEDYYLTSGANLFKVAGDFENLKLEPDTQPFLIGRKVAELKEVKITVDGEIEDWADISFKITLPEDPEIIKRDTKGGKIDIKADIRIAYDSENFYLWAEVLDDVPFHNKYDDGDIYKNDTIEMAIGLNTAKNTDELYLERRVYGEYDAQIGFATGNKGPEFKSDPKVFNFSRNMKIAGAQIVTAPIPDGYRVEASIPWKALGKSAPSKGDYIGFTVAVDDADMPYTVEESRYFRDVQYVWTGTGQFWQWPSDWGLALIQ